MIKTLALSTVSFFSYNPDLGLIRREMAKKENMNTAVEDMTPTDNWANLT
jgi:hypothetical protein